MRFRITMKELEEWSDDKLVSVILTERMSGLNPYSPLYVRLRKVQDKLEARRNRPRYRNQVRK